jgi:DedD protein
MDRALKERIVGATVLVVFIVLVVPVFLDGPVSDEAVVTESVTLPGQNGQERKRQTIVLERDRSEPVPVPAQTETRREPPPADVSPPADEPAVVAVPAREEPVPAAVVPEPEPEAPAEQPAVAAATQSATGMWAVQLGSFSNKTNAERLAAELRAKGYAAFLSQLSGSRGPLHRVRIGPQKDRSSAEQVAQRLAADGHKGQVVPHP